MRIAVTNDDGIEAPGLVALAEACSRLGHEVVVVAPAEDLSGAAAAIGRVRADQRIDTLRLRLAALPDVPAHAIAGPPGLAAMAACLGAFGDRPDAVVSGVNAGPNTGHAILHSGTVGAALTAGTFGVSALAVSADVADPMRWDTACSFVSPALELLGSAPAGTVLNVNVPSVEPDRAGALRWARLDRFGSVRIAVAGSGDRWLQMEYRETGADLDPESDTALLAAGNATVTAIRGIAEIPPAELGAGDGRPPRLETSLRDVSEETGQARPEATARRPSA